MRGVVAISRGSQSETGLMAQLARCKAAGKGRFDAALKYAEETKASPRVISAIKAPVAALATGDPNLSGLEDANFISTQFVPFLAARSLFYRLHDSGGMAKVPLKERLALTTAEATAFVAGEGAAVPVARVAVEIEGIERHRANGLIVITDDMLRAMGSSGDALISRELRRAISRAVDGKFVEIITADLTPIASAGGGAEAAAVDLRALLAAIDTGAESRLIFAMSADVAKVGSTLVSTNGGYLFPALSPTGGEILNIEATVCDALDTGTLMLIDAVGLAGDADTIDIETSNQADILMETAPAESSTTPTPAEVVSMFQTDSTAIMASAFFGAVRARDRSVATVSGVTWAGEGEGEGE